MSTRDCTAPGIGQAPIDDPSAGPYLGRPRGKFPPGNDEPLAHLVAGEAIAQQVARNRLDPLTGQPDSDGSIVMAAIGFSHSNIIMKQLVPLVTGDPTVNPRLRIVNLCKAGVDAPEMVDPLDPTGYWTSFVPTELGNAGVSHLAVQLLWIMSGQQSIPAPGTFPGTVNALAATWADLVRRCKRKFPRARIAFCSPVPSHAYCSPPIEPWPFEQGFAVQGLVREQLLGNLNYDPSLGTVEAPWVTWGVQPWRDGAVPFNGHGWECPKHVIADGVHPSPAGGLLIAQDQVAQWRRHRAAQPWFLKELVAPGTPGATGGGPTEVAS